VPSDLHAPDPLLIPDTEAARLCGIARATWHRLRAAGRIGPAAIRLGRAVRYRRSEVEEWAAAGCPRGPDVGGNAGDGKPAVSPCPVNGDADAAG
jgi:excisionase family DNA binding protein